MIVSVPVIVARPRAEWSLQTTSQFSRLPARDRLLSSLRFTEKGRCRYDRRPGPGDMERH
jgi:hypothetical protein